MSEKLLQSDKLIVSKGRLATWAVLGLFWFLAVYPFLFQLTGYGNFDNILVKVNLFSEAFVIVLGCVTLRKRSDMILIGSFVVLTLFSSCIMHGIGLHQWFNGIRYYIAFLFTLPAIRYVMATPARRDFFIERMDRSLYIFLWIQWPCILYQLVMFNGWDYAGGSLGFYYSGVISTLIYLISFYLMLRRWNPDLSYGRNLLKNWMLIILLGPSLLNETKISFLYMGMYFFFLIPMNRKFLKNFLVFFPALLAVLGLAYYFYAALYSTRSDGREIFSLEYLEYYTLGDDVMLDLMEFAYDNSDDADGMDFQRGLKWAALPWILNEEPTSWIWGYGIGQIKGVDDSNPTKMARNNQWLLQGTQMTFEILIIETGFLGVFWLLCAICVLFRSFYRHVRHQKQLCWYMGVLTVVILAYNNAFNSIVFFIIFYYVAYLSSRWEWTVEADRYENSDSK